MEKVDVKKTQKPLYSGRKGVWERLDVPPMTFLAVDGQGNPDGPDYAAAIGALYPLAYGLKFQAKAAGADFVVPPLEALWWAEDPTAFVGGRRDEWHWRAMIRIPVPVTDAMVAAAHEKARGKSDALDRVQQIEEAEGDCLQTLHVGPYSDEAPVLADLHDRVMPGMGLTFGKPHHEIYLSDPRRVAPEKLRTILRQPVVPIPSP